MGRQRCGRLVGPVPGRPPRLRRRSRGPGRQPISSPAVGPHAVSVHGPPRPGARTTFRSRQIARDAARRRPCRRSGKAVPLRLRGGRPIRPTTAAMAVAPVGVISAAQASMSGEPGGSLIPAAHDTWTGRTRPRGARSPASVTGIGTAGQGPSSPVSTPMAVGRGKGVRPLEELVAPSGSLPAQGLDPAPVLRDGDGAHEVGRRLARRPPAAVVPFGRRTRAASPGGGMVARDAWAAAIPPPARVRRRAHPSRVRPPRALAVVAGGGGRARDGAGRPRRRPPPSRPPDVPAEGDAPGRFHGPGTIAPSDAVGVVEPPGRDRVVRRGVDPSPDAPVGGAG